MTMRRLLVSGLVWALSLVGVGVWAQGGAAPQPVAIQFPGPGSAPGEIISGEDIGFQLVPGRHSSEGTIVGKLMVRVNGQWLEATSPAGTMAVMTK